MTTTPRDIIAGSLRLLGVLASGEVPSANEENEAFQTFLQMLESFSNERLMISSIVQETFPVVANQGTYTFGPTGDFDSARPQLITNISIEAYGTNPIAQLPITIINKDEYAAIIVKEITSSIPLYMYNDDADPLANINFWPVPSVNTNVQIWSWKPLASYANLSSSIILPPGYLRMLKYNLAIDLGPEYGKTLNEAGIAIAIQSKENLKRMNSKPLYLGMDPALQSPKGSFNWLTGDTVGDSD